MTDKFLKEIREKISCPLFGDDHYGEWGILNVNQRRTIKRLIDYMDGQEAYIKNQQAEIKRLNNLKRFEKFISERIHTDKKHNVTWDFATREAEQEAFEQELEKLFDISTARTEAIKEFAERLCEGRVSNDPVVIAVKVELKEMVGDDK